MFATKIPSQFDLLKYAIKNCFGHRVDELKNIVVSSINGEELPQVGVNVTEQSNGCKGSSAKTITKKPTLKRVRKSTSKSKDL